MNLLYRALKALVIQLILLTVLSGLSPAQNSPDVQQYVQKARAAYKEKDYPTFIENLKAALALRPNYGPYLYNLAIGYALSGNKAEALSWLGRVAEMGLVYPAAAESAFASIKDTDEFNAIVAKFEENARPVGTSAVAFTVHEKGFVPEGIAYDPVERTFYLGSVYKRKIISINSAGVAADFSSEKDGLWSVMGMRVDARRRLLWVCTAAHAQMMNFKESENGMSGILKYDLKTKKLIGSYLIKSEPKNHWLGDLVLNAEGDVFASDSLTPAIYFLDRRKDSLEIFLQNESFVNPQGLAFSADGKHLFMADYLKGIFAIDMKSKAVSLLSPAPRTTMFGFDGLYYVKGKLIGVQNGVKPARLAEMSLNANGTAVERFTVIEANNPHFDEPTLAVLVGDTLYYIANSQWETIDSKGNLASEDKLRDPIILKLKL